MAATFLMPPLCKCLYYFRMDLETVLYFDSYRFFIRFCNYVAD